MKKLSLLILASMLSFSLSAQTFTEWHDAGVNEINRAPMHATFKLFDNAEAAAGKYCDAAYPYRHVRGVRAPTRHALSRSAEHRNYATTRVP